VTALLEVGGPGDLAVNAYGCLTGDVDDARAGRDRDVQNPEDLEQFWRVDAVGDHGLSLARLTASSSD